MALRRQTVILLAALALHMPVSAAAEEPLAIGVMDFSGKGGVPQEKVDALADMLSEEITHLGEVRVIGKLDIQSMLSLEKQKRLMGCDDRSCMSEIGGNLGIRWMVSGNLSRFGETYVLNLKLVNVAKTSVAGRVMRRIRGGEEELLSEVTRSVHDLFSGVADEMGLVVPETVTVASRHAQPIAESPSAVTVITREDIETTGATNIPDLLRLVPGMEVIMATVALPAITSRMFWTDENNHYLVLIDGREANVELVGQPAWEGQPISLDDVERIEVIRGAGSSLYGSNALAGVISITTRAVPEKTSAWVRTMGGEAGMAELSVGGSTRLDKWGFSLSGTLDYKGRFADPRVFAKQGWKIRSVVEYLWSDSRKFLLDAGINKGWGPVATAMGSMYIDLGLRTVRLAYESRDLRGQLYWSQAPMYLDIDAPLEYAGVQMASFKPMYSEFQSVDMEVQKTLSDPLDSLLFIIGGGGRISWFESDDFLDADTFADKSSPRYHQYGITHWELRGGAFAHMELSPAYWMKITGGLRLDYNTETGEFANPRLATIFQPSSGQFLRLGAARAFRKPAALETQTHFAVEFPEGSPIIGDDQSFFQEFMTRVIGNADLENEDIWTIDAGYVGKFFDEKLTVALDLYYNLFSNMIAMESNIVPGERGLPDLESSSVQFVNITGKIDILGSELSVRLNPSRSVLLMASWAHREVFVRGGKSKIDRELYMTGSSPKNLITFGGRYWSEPGLVGSLYVHCRSEFSDRVVTNPEGLFSPWLAQKMDNVFLVLGRLGWRWLAERGFKLEVGVKLFLPVSPFSPPHFRYYEKGGGVTLDGRTYGGVQLARMVTAYLQGSY